ncbi:acyl-CoA dehydrogenase family protein [Nocardioides daejeonensis]|uniref:acyl-CoA dehydrogenase family protein n=1 Tax=Nocardioides daejeonensis TaxID=1046556 RepID=UPI000D74D504|nr:acyl-CoA dehydrogenase family protein [Nocardioides daejeonensis]
MVRMQDIDAASVDAWLAARAPLHTAQDAQHTGVALIEESGADEGAVVEAARAWQREWYDAGYAELGAADAAVVRSVAANYRLPDLRPLLIGLHILGPALREHGTAALQRRYLTPILRGEILACQLFSEPEAGSDLAGVRAKAVRVPGGWSVSGQKVWTSNAHFADVAELLVRTDSASSRHAGLSMFVMHMDAPGVDVRPLRQMTGGAAFNEVFLNDVFVPEENLIGEEGTGWRVAMTSLSGERAALGGEFEAVPPQLVEKLAAMALRRGRSEDPLVWGCLADAAVADFAHRAVVEHGAADPQLAGAAASVTKLMVTDLLEVVTSAVLEIGDAEVLLERGASIDAQWSEFILGKPGVAIAGGANEIQKNVIAERHLGLPKG